MKKFTFLLLMFFIISFSASAQVQVGTGTNTNQKLPFYAYYGYTYSQSIYLASEINAPGTITSIQWYYAGSGTLTNSQQLVIYMGNTTKTSFSSTTDWEPLTSLTAVYTGGIPTGGTPGWKTLTLTTPFVYNGTSNLIVAVDENQLDYDYFSDKFYNTAVTGNRSIFVYNDQTNFDPATPPEANETVAFVPNIIFGGITQACSTPYYVVTNNVTTTSAAVSWQASPTTPSGGSDYYFSTSNVAPTSTTIPSGSVTSGLTFNLTSLIPETNYYVWVRNNCGAGLYSSWSTVTNFKTDCIAIPAFIENFDTISTPNIPSCWSKILRGGTDLSAYASIETIDWQSQSPSNSVLLSTSDSNTTVADIILVSPNLSTLSLGTYRLKFFAKGNSNTNISIGTMSSNDINGVFTPIISYGLSNTFEEYVVNFDTYTGTNHYIGFRVSNANLYGDAFLDSIKWELAPLCPDVTEINVPEVTTTGATIAWTPGSGTSSLSWDVAVGPATATDPSLLPFVNSTTTTKNIIGLTPNTTYNVWVRSVCNTTLGNGAWIGPIAFTTACLPIVNFYENFNQATTPNLPSCWGKIIRGTTVSQYSWVETTEYSNIFPQPNIAVQLYNDNSAPTDDIILVSPSLSTLSLGTYRLKFYAKHNFDPASLQVGTLNTNTNAAVFTVIQGVTLTANTTQYTVEFDYTGTDPYIGIRLNANLSYSSVYIDNILWEISPACLDVTLINVPSVSTNNATVNWTAGGSETQWNVAVGSTTVTDPSTLTPLTATATTFIYPGLTDNTTYNVWVRSVCTVGGNGAWIGPVSFTTACIAVATFSENFQTVTTPNLPGCWGKILRGATLANYAYIETSPWSNMPEPTTAVVMNTSDSSSNDDIILVSPNVSTLALGTYRLKFKAKGESTLQIGTLSSNTDTAVFTSIQNVTTNNTPTEYVVNFDSYTGTNTYIGIRVNTNTAFVFVELDNIIWQPIPLCPDVNQLELTGSTMTTATIGWDASTATQWEVVKGATTDTDPSILPSFLTSNPNYTFSTLTAGTSYNVWVRAKCGVTLGNGAWQGPLVITTQCVGIAVPYTENFETSVTPNLPGCTSAINLSAGPYSWYVSNWPGYGFESNTLTYNSDLYTDANAWFFTRGITLTGGQNYTISYRYGGASTDLFFYNNNLKVMYGVGASAAEMTLPIADYVNFAVDAPVAQSISFSPLTTGVYYFGFNVYSPNNSNYMFIDDIVIDAELATNDFNSSNFSYYPNPVKDVLNISYINAITAVSVYNLIGQEVITKNINDNLTKIDMTSLSKGTYLVKVTSDNLVKTIKVIKQ